MHEFLSTWYGLTIFIVFDIVALIAVIAIGYRFCFKRLFDILFSVLCLAVTWPVFLWVYTRYRKYKKAGGEVDGFLRREPVVGRKGATVAVTSFQTLDKEGNLAGEYGKGLSERSYLGLPRLLDVFWGRATFIGTMGLKFQDAAFLDDKLEGRYESRIGIISPLKKEGMDVYDVLCEEATYAENYTLLTDIKVFFNFLLSKIRGEKEDAVYDSYAQSLLCNGDITGEEYASVLESAKEEEKEWLETHRPKK